jgi:hypothetical protein
MKLEPSYQKQVTGGDLCLVNKTDKVVSLRLDQLVLPDGTERKLSPDVRFKVMGDSDRMPPYAIYKGELLRGRFVRATIINQGGTKQISATYRGGMTLELVITDDDVPQ